MCNTRALIWALLLTIPHAYAQSSIQSFDLFNMNSGGGFAFANKPQQITSYNAQSPTSTPTVTISGADKPVPIGELVVLDASVDPKSSNLHSVSYSWTVLPKRDVIVWPDGTKAVFGTGVTSQSYTVILTTSFVFAMKDADRITEIIQRSSTQTVIVNIDNGNKPFQPTNPNTPIQPEQPAGDGSHPPEALTGLAKSANDWVNLVVRSDSNQEEDIKIDAASLSKAFITVAQQIDNGSITDINSIMGTSKTLNDGAIKHKIEWLPWFAKVSEYVEAAYKEGSMREPSQYSKAWKDIAAGLEYFGN